MNSKFILKAFLLILITFVIISSKSYSQSNFEGKIKMKIVSEDDTNYIDYYAKDGKYKIDMQGKEDQGYSIWDPQNKKMIIIMPSKKMYMEMPLDFSNVKNEDKSEKWKENLKDVKFTGNTKTVQGYECKEALYKSDEGTVDIWYTSDLGTFFTAKNGPMGSQYKDMPDEIKEMMDNGFFPMQMVTNDEDGKETSRMEVVDVQKIDLSNDMFEPPADYKKFNMPNIPNLKDLMKDKN